MNEIRYGGRFKQRAGIGTGTTSLLVIFTILCLATLAILSLSTAASSQRIHRRSAEATMSLAVAEGAADVKLAEIDGMLADLQAGTGAGEENAYYVAALRGASAMGCQIDSGKNQITYSVPIDENNELVTKILVLNPTGGERYTVLEQVAVRTGPWEPVDEGELWTGG